MNYRIVIGFAKWMIGIVVYFAASVVVAKLFVLGMQAWARMHGRSLGFVIELRFLRAPVLALCLIFGALYASAMAKPATFGGTARIWRHLGVSYLCCLLGCMVFVRAEFLPLPDFPHNFELDAYLSIANGLAIASLTLGLLSWAHLAFTSNLTHQTRSSALADSNG